MKKVFELEGVELDYWVARARGGVLSSDDTCDVWCFIKEKECNEIISSSEYQPSTNWAQGGPIIEERHILIGYDYIAKKWSAHTCKAEAYGNTALIAAMRCFVASVFWRGG